MFNNMVISTSIYLYIYMWLYMVAGWSPTSMCLRLTLRTAASTDARRKTRWGFFAHLKSSLTQSSFFKIYFNNILLINLSHQVGLVAHSARLNVYGPPSSRGLHNVTAVSRFRPLSVKSSIRNDITNVELNFPVRLTMSLSDCQTDGVTVTPCCSRRDVLLICPVYGYPLDKVFDRNTIIMLRTWSMLVT